MASIEIDNWDLFCKVTAAAMTDLWEHSGLSFRDRNAWSNAIGKAVANIESNDFLMTWQSETQTLLIFTAATSGQVYEANGGCQCQAYICGKPCWHKAARRLIQRYMKEILPPVKTGAAVAGGGSATPTHREMMNRPYMHPTSTRPVATFGGFKI